MNQTYFLIDFIFVMHILWSKDLLRFRKPASQRKYALIDLIADFLHFGYSCVCTISVKIGPVLVYNGL